MAGAQNRKAKGMKGSHKALIVAVVVAIAVSVALSLVMTTGIPGRVQELELKLLDIMFSYRRQIKTDDTIVHIDIDDKSVKEIGRPPWPRIYQARALDVLRELGAKTIVFDLEFDDESIHGLKKIDEKDAIENLITSRFGYLKKDLGEVLAQVEARQERAISLQELKAIVSQLEGVYEDLAEKFLERLRHAVVENDAELSESIAKSGNVLLPFRFSPELRLNTTDEKTKKLIAQFSKKALETAQEFPSSPALVPPIFIIARGAGGFGFTNSLPDEDGIFRHVRLLWNYEGRTYFHLSLMAALRVLGVSLEDVKVVPGKHIKLYNRGNKYMRGGEVRPAAITIPIDHEGRLLINWPANRLKPWQEVFTHIPFLAIENVSGIRDMSAACDEQLEMQLTALSEQAFGGARQELKTNPELIKDAAKLREALEKNEQDMLTSPMARTVAEAKEDLNGDEQAARDIKTLKAFFEDIAALKKHKRALAEEESELVARLKEMVSGKLCLIGEIASLTSDLKHVPVDPFYPGVIFYSAVNNQILTRQFIREAPTAVNVVLIFVFCVVVSLFVSRKSVFYSSMVTILLILVYAAGVFYLFSEKMIYVKAGYAPSGMLACYIIMTAYRQLTEEKEKRRIRTLFEHYNSPAMVEQMVQDPSRVRLGGEVRELTVFFSDIEGFTGISEKMPPEKLVAFLNRYLGAMTDIILESGGTLDKYEGDAIIAFWGAPLPLENHARSACLAAIDNQKKLAGLCKVFADEGLPQINCRIGISSGEMVVGNMGSLQRFDYTVMGDAVNLGQRLEVSNKLYDTRILISERTCELARESIEVREMDLLYVKGKEKPVRVFELLGRKGEAGEKMR